MSIDARGGLGLAGIDNVAPELYGGGQKVRAVFSPQKTYVAALCSVDEAIAMTGKLPSLKAPNAAPFIGAGLRQPSVLQSPAAQSWLTSFNTMPTTAQEAAL